MESSLNRRAALVAAASSSFLSSLSGGTINVAIPTIGREFGSDAVWLSWVATAYILASAMFLVPFGRMADIYGRKRIFSYGVIGFTIASVLCSLATSTEMLVAFRILQGFGAALMYGTGTAIITSAFPPEQRGRMLGTNIAATYIGISTGPYLGGIITQFLGWRATFLVNVPIGVVTLAILWLGVKLEWAGSRGEKVDVVGSGLYALSLVVFMVGLTSLPEPEAIALIFLGIGCLALFVRWEIHAPSPVLSIRLFTHNRVFAFSSLSSLINYGSTFAVSFLLSLYLQYVKGLSPQQAGLVLVAQPAMMVVFAPLVGRLSDRVEPRKVSSTGMFVTVLAIAGLSFLDQSTPMWLVVPCLMTFGLGLCLFLSPNTNAVMSAAGKREYGVAAATNATMRLTGQMLSMGIAMLIFALVIGRVQITAEYVPQFLTSWKIALYVYGMLCTVGIFTSLARGNVRATVRGEVLQESEA